MKAKKEEGAAMFFSFIVHRSRSSFRRVFPARPGFYYSPFKFLAVCRSTCAGAHLLVGRPDARELKLPRKTWNPLLLGRGCSVAPPSGHQGLRARVLLPAALVPRCRLSTSSSRNERVEANEQVLDGPRHLRRLAARLSREKSPGGGRGNTYPIRLSAKAASATRRTTCAARTAAESRGYPSSPPSVREPLERRATDIPLEPTKEKMSSLRIDGILRRHPVRPHTGDSVVNIFKVARRPRHHRETQPPGRSFSASSTATAPSTSASPPPAASPREDGPAHPRPRRERSWTCSAWHASSHAREDHTHVVATTHGLFSSAGRRGAGKSTTCMPCLSEIDRLSEERITVENPSSTTSRTSRRSSEPKAGKTFAGELRSILRRPDVIYIGEIRDQEIRRRSPVRRPRPVTWSFTTLHANDTTTASPLLDLAWRRF